MLRKADVRLGQEIDTYEKKRKKQQEEYEKQQANQPTGIKGYFKNLVNTDKLKEISSDGFQAKDILDYGKLAAKTGVEGAKSIGRGILSTGENIGDYAAYHTANALQKAGIAEDYMEEVKRATTDNLNRKILAPTNDSLLGTSGQSTLEGVGNSLSNMAIGGVLGTGATYGSMFLSSAGGATTNKYAEIDKTLQQLQFQKQLATGEEKERLQAEIDDLSKNKDKYINTYATISGLAEMGSEAMFGGIAKGLKIRGIGTGAEDDLIRYATKNISNMLARNLISAGISATGEGIEEIMSDFGEALAEKASTEKDKSFTELLADKDWLGDFMNGFMSSLLTQGGETIKASRSGIDITTGLTQRESDVVKELAKEQQAKDGGKLSDIERDIENKLKEGTIKYEDIQRVLSKDTYNELDTLKGKQRRISELESRIKELDNDNNRRLTSLNEYNSMKEELNQLKNEDYSRIDELKERLENETNELTKGKDGNMSGAFAQSYLDRQNRGVAYQVDENTYNKASKELQGLYDSARRIMNNTVQSRKFIDSMAKLSKSNGLNYQMTNNQELKELGKTVDGKVVNGLGYRTENGNTILINVDAADNLNTILGHETTHFTETAGNYKDYQKFLQKNFKEEYDSLKEKYESIYEGLDADIDSEITAQLTGEKLFNDPDFIQKLTEKPTLFNKIKNFIDDLVTKFTGTKEEKQLKDLQKKFQEVYDKTDFKKELESKSKVETKEDEIVFEPSKVEKPIERKIPTRKDINNIEGVSTLRQEYQEARKETGNKKTIVLNDGEKLTGTYKLVEAGSVTPSHNSENFTKSDNFPTTETGSTINDRDYENDKTAQQLVKNKAANYDGRAFNDNGVIVTKDGIVVSGNDRTMAGEIAARNNTDSAYIEYLKDNASEYGFTEEQINSMDHPRVVLELDNNLDYDTQTFAKFNKDAKKSKSVSEKAREFSKTISNETIERISDTLQNFDRIDDLYNSQNASKELLNILLNDDIIQDNEISEYYDGNKFTGAGKDLIEATVLGNVIEEDNLRFFRNNNDLKFKIMKNAPMLIQNKTFGEYSILDEINRAIEVYKNAQQANMSVEELNNQTSLFGDSDFDLLTKKLAQIIEGKGYKNFQNFLEQYNQLAELPANGQVDMFSGDVLSKENILQQALNISDYAPVNYSLSEDSQGRKLSKDQQDYFKDSKVRDENGNLMVMYHGTPNGEFTVFRPGSYFSPNQEYASGYQNTWASSISSGKVETTPRTYEVYLNIKNPFSLQDETAKRIYLDEYVKGGNSMYLDPYSDYTDYVNGLEELDWTEGEDFKEWLQENHPEYDGLILDEGGDGGYGEAEYRWRGKSYLPFNSNQVKNVDNTNPTDNPDIRYSLSEGNFTTGQDSDGRKLSESQNEFFKNSKVTDGNGNLQVLYNGSGNHTVYLPGYMSDESLWGKGIYLTPFREVAENYGSDIKEVYVDIKNPLTSGKTITFEQYNNLYKAINEGEEAYREEYDMYNDDFDLLWDLVNKGSWADYADEIIKYTGKDGIIVNNPDAEMADQMVIAFRSNQIKNVDNLTPTEDPDIRYSLQNQNEQLAPYNPNGIYGQDVRLENQQVREDIDTLRDIAPIRTNIDEEGDTILNADIEKDIAPTSLVVDTQPVPEGKGRSSYWQNVGKQDFLTDESKELIQDEDDVKYYDVVSNKETLSKAYDKLRTGGTSEVLNWNNKFQLDEKGKVKSKVTAEDVAEGWILMKQYQDDGNYDAMIQVAKTMRNMGTEAGQAVQAFNIMSRMTPEGMVKYAQSELTEAFDKASKNKSKQWIDMNEGNFDLTPDETRYIIDTMNEVQNMEDGYEKKVKLAQIQALISNKIPTNLGNEIKSWMRISMLFNPKTQVRNVAGNAVIVPVNAAADVFSSAIDRFLARKTGVRTTGTFNVKAALEGLKRGAYEATNDYKLGINTKDVNMDRFEAGQGKSFTEKTILGKTLNNTESLLNYVMDLGDRVFSEAVFENSLQNQMELNNTTEITQEMLDIARTEALQRTWNDNNNYTKFVLDIRKALNKANFKGYGLGDVLIPFAKTPANLTKAIVDYSPVGLVNSIVKGKNLKNAIETGKFTAQQQHEFVQTLGKATAGTLLYVLGYALAKAGISTGKSDDDKDVSNFMKNTLGISSYSINVGGKSYTYDWAQPIAAPFSITANIVSSKNNEEALAESIVANLDTAGSILMEQSFLQSLNETLNNNDGVVNGLLQQALDLPARAIPTLSKQIADLTDDTQRQTYEYNEPIKTAINKMKSKIPGLSEDLAPVVDTMGREVKKYGGKNNLFNVFLNPANVNTENISSSAKEIYDLYKSTGDKTIMPRTAPYYVNKNGEKIVLNSTQKAEYQRISGGMIESQVQDLMNNTQYINMSDEEKASIVKKIVDYSYNIAQHDVLGTEISQTYQTAYLYSKVGNVNDWYLLKSQEFTSDKTEEGKTISGSLKNKVVNYVNEMDISAIDKVMLIELNGYRLSDYDMEVYNYINGMDLSYDDKLALLKKMGVIQ